MRLLFKIIAIIGGLSFLGGLKNGVFFVGGLILAGIFGYLGWRSDKKNKQDHNSVSYQENAKTIKASINLSSTTDAVKQVLTNDKDLSEIQLENSLQSCRKKKELLKRSYDDGIFSSTEYYGKNEELELEILKLTYSLNLKIVTKKVLLDNTKLFDNLIELKEQGLITNEEYNFKYNDLLNLLLQKLTVKNNESKRIMPSELRVKKTLDTQIFEKNDKRRTNYLLWLSLITIVTVTIVIYYNFSETRKSNSSLNYSKVNTNKSSSEDEIINKSNIQQNISEGTKSNNLTKNNVENMLDRIYLGTNLFHEGGDGTWGRSTILKQGEHYRIKGEHKLLNGDWVRIEGGIVNPALDSFTFIGKITAYSPTTSYSFNKDNHLRDFYKVDRNIEINDTCIWKGTITAYKLFKNRKYWRIKIPGYCYHYTTDIDIFHN